MKGTATAGNRTLMFVAILSGPLSGSLPTDPALAGKGPPVLSTSNLSVEGGMLFQTEYDERSREGDLIARRVDRHGNAVPDEHYPFDPGEPGYVAGREGEIRVFHGAWRAGRRVTA